MAEREQVTRWVKRLVAALLAQDTAEFAAVPYYLRSLGVGSWDGGSALAQDFVGATGAFQSFTFLQWVRATDALVQGLADNVSFYVGNAAGSKFARIHFAAGAVPGVEMADGNGVTLAVNNAVALTNAWHQVGLTWNQGTLTMTVYLDGAVLGTDTDAAWAPIAGIGEAYVLENDATGTRFAGDVRNNGAWNRVLSTAEVLSLFGAGPTWNYKSSVDTYDAEGQNGPSHYHTGPLNNVRDSLNDIGWDAATDTELVRGGDASVRNDEQDVNDALVLATDIPFAITLAVKPGGTAIYRITPEGPFFSGRLVSAVYLANTATSSALGGITARVFAITSGAPMTNALDIDGLGGENPLTLVATPVSASGFEIAIVSTNADATAGLGLQMFGHWRRIPT